MRRALFVFLIAVSLGLGSHQQPAIAGGIPTIDIAGLTQQLVQYLQQMKDYQELLNQSSTQTAQYLQMVRDYQQVLRQYQSYLNQLRSIQRLIDVQDWNRLMSVISHYAGEAKRSYAVMTMDPESETYEEDLDTVLSEYGHVPRNPMDVEADAEGLGTWSEEYARRVREDYEAYELMKDRLRMTSENQKKSKERIDEIIPEHIETLNSLGDESDLATAQAMAAQNITIMNQLESMVQIQNQTLMNMENQAAERAAQSAKFREAEIERLKNRQTTEPLGRDRWGEF